MIPKTAGNQATVTTSTTKIAIPTYSDGSVTLESTRQQAAPVLPVKVYLPREAVSSYGNHKLGKIAKDGTMVYSSTTKDGVSTAVQALGNSSVRIQTVMMSNKSGSTFTYSFGNAVPQLQANGTVNLVQTTQVSTKYGVVTVDAIVGTIDRAWAVDANGKAVTTRYTINQKKELVQIVQTDKNTRFPVVADPTVGWTWQGINIYFNRSETKALANQWIGLASLVAGILPYAAYAGVAMGTVNWYANWAYNAGMCLKWTYPITITTFGRYSGGSCR